MFYQTASAAVLSASVVSLAAGGQPVRVIDAATLGVGIFLVLGRIGCFSVACCHGRLARRGVIYGPSHVAIGFWSRWAGRPLWPIQLAEAGISLVLVIAALVVGFDAPGLPALIYIAGYAASRFVLELARGDAARPALLGVSEAQWTALATVVICAVWRPSPPTIAVAAALGIATTVLAVTRAWRELLQPRHLRELDRAAAAAIADGAKHETSLGVALTLHLLPDGRADWILSSTHPRWSNDVARRLADALWPEFEVVEGRLAPIVHVIVPRPVRAAL